VRGWSSRGRARRWLLATVTLVGAGRAQADGGFPDPRQVLLPLNAPEQIIVATNFGLLVSEDDGATWSFSCEQRLNAYAGPYVLGAPPRERIFAIASGAGLIHSDDGSCTWAAATGSLTAVLPYAVALDPTDPDRVYVIGASRETLSDESIYTSDDGGVTFAEPVFTAPAESALLNVVVAPSDPRTVFASMFSTPENHPHLLRSDDAGESWEVVTDLVDQVGESPFELLAVDPSNADRLFIKILGPSAETLGVSNDGGLTFVQSVSIPGKLNAFLKLESGTILVGGTTGTGAIGYRSLDDAASFEPWPEAPHVHALAERNGKLYVAADNFADGYAIAVSADEGAHLTPLAGFNDVRSVKSCVSQACADSCAYYADINLWPSAVCGTQPGPVNPPDPVDAGPSVESGGSPSDQGAPGGDTSGPPANGPRISGGCGCTVVPSRDIEAASAWLLATALCLARRGPARRKRRRS
jgi:photosystem II stability/assembly factor-like uncharacterized protein